VTGILVTLTDTTRTSSSHFGRAVARPGAWSSVERFKTSLLGSTDRRSVRFCSSSGIELLSASLVRFSRFQKKSRLFMAGLTVETPRSRNFSSCCTNARLWPERRSCRCAFVSWLALKPITTQDFARPPQLVRLSPGARRGSKRGPYGGYYYLSFTRCATPVGCQSRTALAPLDPLQARLLT
jgi:hypothetical protein